MPVAEMTKDELRSALDRLGWTQVDLALRLGYTGRAGQTWALGERPVPGPVALMLRLLIARPELLQVIDGMAPPPERQRARPDADKRRAANKRKSR